MTWNAILMRVVEALLPLLALLVTVAIGYLTILLRAQAEKVKNETARASLIAAIAEAERVAVDAVTATQQVLVNGLKEMCIRDSSWTSRTSGTTSSLRDIAYADGLWVVVGLNGTILTSTTGTTWTPPTSGTSNVLNSVAYADGLWVVVGSNGTISTARVTIP